jgi:hypothetical protein
MSSAAAVDMSRTLTLRPRLYGITLVQTYLYFETFKSDRRALKTLVSFYLACVLLVLTPARDAYRSLSFCKHECGI